MFYAEYFNLKFMLVNLFLYYAVVNALHKCWCVQHFTCIGCNISLNLKWVIAGFFCTTGLLLCFKCLSISSQLSLLWSRVYHITYLNFMSLKAARNLIFKRDGIAWSCQFSTCSDDPFFLGRSKFHEFDMQPLCKKCYEKMPLELKKRLKKAEQTASRK